MKTKKLKLICLVWSISFHFLFPSTSYSSDFISLVESEKKLIEQGDIIVREINNGGRAGRMFEAIGYINSPQQDIVQVLTAYEKYPEFMPNVSRIEIVSKAGNESVLNYTLTLPLGKIKKYRLRIHATEPKNQAIIIKWQLLNWPGLKKSETIKDTNGYWRIEEKSKNRSLVQYHVYTDPGPIPMGLGWIVDILTEKSVPETLLKTRERVQGN